MTGRGGYSIERPNVALPVLSGALCAEHPDPGLWFRPADQAEAVSICRSCPVLAKCAAWADQEGVVYGVWGGVPRWVPHPHTWRRRDARADD